MDLVLQNVNLALQEAVNALEGPLRTDRLTALQTTDSLPDKATWNLASQTIDLADRVLRLLQQPSLQLAESYLGQYNTAAPP
jgi:gliotoxin/aspirochlorine biosynthesis O-methyltransferase